MKGKENASAEKLKKKYTFNDGSVANRRCILMHPPLTTFKARTVFKNAKKIQKKNTEVSLPRLL